MTAELEIRLPDDVMEHLPAEPGAMLRYVSEHVDRVIARYEERFLKRVKGPLSEPLSRYEKAILKDFLLDALVGEKLRESLEKMSKADPGLLAAASK